MSGNANTHVEENSDTPAAECENAARRAIARAEPRRVRRRAAAREISSEDWRSNPAHR